MLPLADVHVIESASDECPIPIRLAIGMCGRITSDLGAQVEFADAAPLPDPFDKFLNAGKVVGPERGRKQVRLSDHLDRTAEAVKTQVIFRLFPGDDKAPPSSEFTICAMGGLLDIVGDPYRSPLRLGGRQLAYAAALSAYTGLAAALGRADYDAPVTIDVNFFDVALWLNWKTIAVAALGGEPPTRAGAAADWQVVRCADGWMAIVYQDKDWRSLVGLVGDERLADPALATPSGRLLHTAEIASIVEEQFVSRTREDIFRAASALRIPLGPVWTMPELLKDQQNTSRSMFAQRDGRFIPALPILWNGTRMPIGTPT